MVHAKTEEADGAPAEVEGDIPAPHVPTGGAGDRPDQPDSTGMGALRRRGGLPPMLWLHQRLGGKEGAAACDACAEPQGLWLEEVEAAVALWHFAIGSQLSGKSATAESAPSARGPITLHTKHAGKRSAGKPHAAFDVAGAGNVATVEGGHAMPSGLTVPTLLKDRMRLWKQGIRDLVMTLCCALHTFRVRLTPWQPMV